MYMVWIEGGRKQDRLSLGTCVWTCASIKIYIIDAGLLTGQKERGKQLVISDKVQKEDDGHPESSWTGEKIYEAY